MTVRAAGMDAVLPGAGLPRVVPVVLGCCPTSPRCLLCPPPPPAPDPESVRALVELYQDASAVRVGFYGGEPPSDELLDAIGGLPFVARVRPDLLTRARARELQARGATGIELDVLTFRDDVLKMVGRPYRSKLVLEQLDGLASLGLSVGVVLAPGLPGTSHDDAVADARLCAPRIRFARVHPVLVLKGAALWEAHLDGAYTPLSLAEAVTTCRAVVDVLHEASVDVIRVGQNPGPDGLGRAVAGPRHPSFRQLVDARRVLAVLEARLEGTAPGSRVSIRCHPADETCTRGPYNQHVRSLRAAYRLAEVVVRPDPTLARGEWVVAEEEP
jgi:hypothetical protein